MPKLLQKKDYFNPGDVFKDWTVIRFLKKDKHRNYLYLCVCKCGFEQILQKGALVSRNRYFSCMSCWADRKFKLDDIIGKVFGETLVLSRIKEARSLGTLYMVQCLRCKNLRQVQRFPLRNLKSKTCQACANRERFSKK